jgi:hypothetical protein
MRYSFFVLILSFLLSIIVSTLSGEQLEKPLAPASEVSLDQFRPNPKLVLELPHSSNYIRIDGVIDSTWKSTVPFGNFTEFQPIENRQPKVLTSGYITYDDQNLYIAFICKDPEISKLRASLTDRDNIFDDDWVCVSIDPQKNHLMAYEFYVNPRGIQGDMMWEANGNEDFGFDMVWYSDAQIFDGFWTVEMKIPFSSLRFPSTKLQNWSIHMFRQYPREDNYRYSWMPISQDNNSLMSQAGSLKLTIPEVTTENKKIELLPYIIANQHSDRIQNSEGSRNGSWEYHNPNTRIGFGFKYGVSSNFIADFTYNPDFSQIEADAGQISVNNPFALFYAEKRPFFQEGNDIYTVDRPTNGAALDQYVDLFYSRSINNPLVAAKVSGKSGKMSLGITSAFDQNTPFVIPFEDESAVLATNKKSYNTILRAKYDMGNQSWVGLFISDRRFQEPGSNSVASLDASIRLTDKYTASAITALTHTKELDDKMLSGYLRDGSFSIRGSKMTNGLDGDSFYGTLLRAKVERESRKWISVLAYQDFSPGFRADNGFISINSYRNIDFVNTYYFRFEDHPVFTFIRPQLTTWRKYNYDGVLKDTGIRGQLAFSFRNQTFVQFSAFLFNKEHLRGKQFDNARSGWMFIQNRTFKSFFISGFIHLGDQINRFGVEGDPKNPFEIVPSLRYQTQFTLKPTAKISNDISYTDFTLWSDHRKIKIVSQYILRNALTYQFNKNISLRLIGEYNVIDSYSNSLDRRIKQRFFSIDPLFSYKLNAFSVFYLGGNLHGNNDIYLNWNNSRLTSQTIFLKFQYLFSS